MNGEAVSPHQLIVLEIIDKISLETACQTLKNELKPWLKKEWGIPLKANAGFVCKMEDILDVYKRPHDENRPLVCMDELNKQMIKEIRCLFPTKEEEVLKYDRNMNVLYL